MKNETLAAVLLFFVMPIGIAIISLSDDVSEHARIAQAEELKQSEQARRNEDVIAGFNIRQEMARLGCITLDCAIAKSMK